MSGELISLEAYMSFCLLSVYTVKKSFHNTGNNKSCWIYLFHTSVLGTPDLYSFGVKIKKKRVLTGLQDRPTNSYINGELSSRRVLFIDTVQMLLIISVTSSFS